VQLGLEERWNAPTLFRPSLLTTIQGEIMQFDGCGATGDVTLTGWFEKFDQPPFIGFHLINPTGSGILYQFAASADVSWTGKVQLGAYGGGLWSYVRGNVQRAPNGAFVFIKVKTVFQGTTTIFGSGPTPVGLPGGKTGYRWPDGTMTQD
jgi:hypothetical protein